LKPNVTVKVDASNVSTSNEIILSAWLGFQSLVFYNWWCGFNSCTMCFIQHVLYRTLRHKLLERYMTVYDVLHTARSIPHSPT